MTFERIVRARSEPHNWLTYYGAYDGQRFSQLNQINAGNVSRMQAAWVFQAAPIGLIANPPSYSLEAAPLVVDGVMYSSGARRLCLGARRGDRAGAVALPPCDPARPAPVLRQCEPRVAVARGRVFYSSPNGNLVALDARTRAPVWTKIWLDPRAGEARPWRR